MKFFFSGVLSAQADPAPGISCGDCEVSVFVVPLGLSEKIVFPGSQH